MALKASAGILPDVEVAVRHALAGAAATHDLLLSSGGVSAGDEDHVKAAVEQAGALAFWRVGLKPGRPVAMGVVRGTPFIGLPGNPVAAFVTFGFLARPLIAELAGEHYQPPLPVPVTCGFSHRKKAGRREHNPSHPVRRRESRVFDGTKTKRAANDDLYERRRERRRFSGVNSHRRKRRAIRPAHQRPGCLDSLLTMDRTSSSGMFGRHRGRNDKRATQNHAADRTRLNACAQEK